MDNVWIRSAALLFTFGALGIVGCQEEEAVLPPASQVESLAEPGGEEPAPVPPENEQLAVPPDEARFEQGAAE